jgi:polar amino acid transport system substrate-binding protein
MRFSLLWAAIISLSLPALSWAEPLRLVTGDGYAPFTGQALPGGGILSQVVQTALSRRQVDSELYWRPWNRGLLMTLNGEYDATFPYVRSAELEQDYHYSEPLLLVRQHIFSRAGEVYEVDDLSALAGKRLCYPLGWQLPVAIQGMVEQGLLTRHAPIGLNECARLLLLGRDDFFIANGPLGEVALSLTEQSSENFRRSQSAFAQTSLHVIVPRRHPHAHRVLQRFNEGLALLRDGNEYQRLIEGYLLQREGQASR